MKAFFLLGLITAKQLHKNSGASDGATVEVPIQNLVAKTAEKRSTFQQDDEDYGYTAGAVDTEDYMKDAP